MQLPQSADDDGEEPIRLNRLDDYFHNGAKPRSKWRVGAEFEKFALDRLTGRHLSYGQSGGIRSILESLVERFGWEPHYEGKFLTTLSRAGGVISLEPGGQIEFSTPPVETINEIAAGLETHRNELLAVTDPERVGFLAAGVTPFQATEDIPLGVRARHRLMAEYLPKRCPLALSMMKATASTQVAFDYSCEADAMRKLRVALMLSPLVNAIWANSPWYAGRASGFASYRSQIWLGMDPDRSGLLPGLLAAGPSFQKWVDYLLDVPMLFACHDGHYCPAGGATFRQFAESGHEGRYPTLTDWEIHLTTVFPEVRLKQFLEIRGADANPPELALTVPALWKGLLYNDNALSVVEALIEGIDPFALPKLFADVSRTGLNTLFAGKRVLDWAKQIATLARAGLDASEAEYLNPVDAILHVGRSPGMDAPTSVEECWAKWGY